MTEKVTITMLKSIKAKLAADVASHMKRKKISQSDLARRMGTSRAVVHRMLKPNDISMTLTTLVSAAVALKGSVTIRLS